MLVVGRLNRPADARDARAVSRGRPGGRAWDPRRPASVRGLRGSVTRQLEGGRRDRSDRITTIIFSKHLTATADARVALRARCAGRDGRRSQAASALTLGPRTLPKPCRRCPRVLRSAGHLGHRHRNRYQRLFFHLRRPGTRSTARSGRSATPRRTWRGARRTACQGSGARRRGVGSLQTAAIAAIVLVPAMGHLKLRQPCRAPAAAASPATRANARDTEPTPRPRPPLATTAPTARLLPPPLPQAGWRSRTCAPTCCGGPVRAGPDARRARRGYEARSPHAASVRQFSIGLGSALAR